MESDAALHLYKRLLQDNDKKVVLKAIVADDDSSMRALLRHPHNNPKGKLPLEMPEPEWLADPSHRTKVVAKAFYALAYLPKSQSTCTKVDAMRLKRYFGYMIKANRMNEISKIVSASKAVVEHLFNEHMYCDVKWCKPKQQMGKEKKEEGSQSFYRCKKKDKKLYHQLLKVYEPFTTAKRLQESLHPFDTQGNEAMNASISKYAPKTKTYGMTISLTNRVMVCAGINNLGAENYWNSVYSSLELDMGNETTSFLRSQDQNRGYKKHYQSLTRVKIKRVSDNNFKIKELMNKQKLDDGKGMTYGAGVAIEVTETLPLYIQKAENDKKTLLGIDCKWYGCFEKGHKTNAAKKCQYYACYDDEEIKEKMHAYLKQIYPTHYGECYKYSSRINHSLILPPWPSKIAFPEGLQISHCLFMNLFLKKK